MSKSNVKRSTETKTETKKVRGRRVLKDKRPNAPVDLKTVLDWRSAPAVTPLKQLGIEMVGNITAEVIAAEIRETNRRQQLNTATFNLVSEVSQIQGHLGNAVPDYKTLLKFAQEPMGMIANIKVLNADGTHKIKKEVRSPGNLTAMLQDALRSAMIMYKAETMPDQLVKLPGLDNSIKLGDLVKRADGKKDTKRILKPGANTKTSKERWQNLPHAPNPMLATFKDVAPTVTVDGVNDENTSEKKVQVIYRGTPTTCGVDNLFFATYPSEKPKDRQKTEPAKPEPKKMTPDQMINALNLWVTLEIKKNTPGAYSNPRMERLDALQVNVNTLQDIILEGKDQE